MPIEQGRIKALCFDVDGTLSDTDDQFVLRLVRWLSPIHAIYHRFEVHRVARKMVMLTEGPGNWAYGLADRLGLDGKFVALGDILYRLGIGGSERPFQLIEGVEEMLASLHQHYALSIISIRGARMTTQFLKQFNLGQYFEAIATSQTCRHTKPYPDPLTWVAAKLDVPASTCVMVGDTVPDILSGKRVGAQTVGVLCGFGEKRELEEAGADLILNSTAELASFLLS
jgi:phosphoglycolate phosphatase-like HAD superfamily hydrolase